MNSSNLLSIVTFIYGTAAFLYIVSWVFKKQLPGRIATWIAIIAVVGNTGGIALRWIESYRLGIGHAPLSNMYESLVFFAWTIGVIYLVVEQTYKNRIIGAFATPLAFMAIAYASLSPNINDRIQPLIPALKSNWLIAHVITCFIGYAAFAIAFGVSLIYLFKQRKTGDKKSSKTGLFIHFPDAGILDELTHQMVTLGFLFLTIGIITGAVWANSAWGSYWSWDPKETWSLITWFVYATLLHARMMRGWEGKKIAYLSIIGFMAVMFTYFGVNLLPGLHSYGQG
ncbi:MAG: c-type cytochrome biogenesis protein CcsB [Desulfobacterales bacterium]|uniref:Heme exporter protein C n=1 Tax=Candidatus Desulfaltia bathyphila TaxID=2841697 RepID=A0A8J6N5N6_9BACT|nr:c-type cytochrome biogenesis protein CcsB [Candidatus Desulfaltia bathyphila]MBL7195830.1 c-type cytochrome biogenesis protein CcsB [Desulfobacterales bacterium]MBL7207866.1 c-type cytochrome biogenesis protein CcsB [Desulfobacterales bacterium]